MDKGTSGLLSPKDVEQIRKQLREVDDNARAAVDEPSRRRLFGLAVMVVAIFFLGLCSFLPAGSNRWLILTLCVVTLGVGAWQFDRARN